MRLYAIQGRPTPRSVHASHRSPDVAAATAAKGALGLGSDRADMWAKDSGVGLTDVSSLDSPIGAYEKGRRQTAYPVSVTHLAVTVEQDSGGDLELSNEGGRRLVAVALVDEQDNQAGMLGGSVLDQWHLAPAGCAVCRPEVEQHWPPTIVGQAHTLPIKRLKGEVGRWALSRTRGRAKPTHCLKRVHDLRLSPPVAVVYQQLAPLVIEL